MKTATKGSITTIKVSSLRRSVSVADLCKRARLSAPSPLFLLDFRAAKLTDTPESGETRRSVRPTSRGSEPANLQQGVYAALCKPEQRPLLDVMLFANPFDRNVFTAEIEAIKHLEQASESQRNPVPVDVIMPANIDEASFEEQVLPFLANLRPYSLCTLDFRNTHSVGWSELISLLLLTEHLIESRRCHLTYAHVTLPEVVAAFRSTEFFHHLSAYGSFLEVAGGPDLRVPGSMHFGVAKIFKFMKLEEVENLMYTDEPTERIRELIAHRSPNASTGLVRRILKILVELLNNAIEHSGSPGYTLIYSDRKSFRMVVADRGAGLRIGLLRNFPGLRKYKMTDKRALELAFEPDHGGVPRVRSGRGEGLIDTYNQVVKLGAELRALTGSARVQIGKNAPKKSADSMSTLSLGTTYAFRHDW
jgi:hypothetical protein